MKKLILINVGLTIVLAVAALSTFAQSESATGVSVDKDIDLLRRDLGHEVKKIIAMNVPLTADEATKFWPVYDQYAADMAKVNGDFYAIVKDYAANQKRLTDVQAISLVKRWGEAQQKQLQARMRYISQFEKVIPGRKAALFFQVDRRLSSLMDLQVSSEIPLITQ